MNILYNAKSLWSSSQSEREEADDRGNPNKVGERGVERAGQKKEEGVRLRPFHELGQALKGLCNEGGYGGGCDGG